MKHHNKGQFTQSMPCH